VTAGAEDGARLRQLMVERQLAARGIRSEAVLRAMGRVRREVYVPEHLRKHAYDDAPLPIGEGQTISQPYIVAYMLDELELEGGERVLEVGTGSGYAAAVLAEVAAQVYTLERHASLARDAAERLARDGYRNVEVRVGDGTLGWPEAAPFDGIVVAASGPSIPPPLREQLKLGGHLVMPVGGSRDVQELVRVTREAADRWSETSLGAVRFVPLIGSEGWGAFLP
jgi:protein-L-isoaspartate(D-aspartate) O-methyltransferase